MSDFDKVRAILAAATPRPWVPQSRDDGSTFPWYVDTHAYPGGPEPVWAPPQYPVSREDVIAIVVTRNLAFELLAVAEAAEGHWCKRVEWENQSATFREVIGRPAMPECPLCAALDALDAKMKETLP